MLGPDFLHKFSINNWPFVPNAQFVVNVGYIKRRRMDFKSLLHCTFFMFLLSKVYYTKNAAGLFSGTLKLLFVMFIGERFECFVFENDLIHDVNSTHGK